MAVALNQLEEEIKQENSSQLKCFNEQFKFLESCASNPPVLNAIVAKMLMDDERITIPIKALYSLNTDNLVGYLAQNPNITVDVKQIEHAYSALFDWQYRQKFENRFKKANDILHKIINFSQAAYHELKYVHLPGDLARIAFSYLPIGIYDVDVSNESQNMEQENKAIGNRVDCEITKIEYADDVLESTATYPQLLQCFPRETNFYYSQDEAAIVLSYLVKYPRIVDIALANNEFEKNNPIVTESTQSESIFGTIGSFFGKKFLPNPSLKPMGSLKNIEKAQQAINNYLVSENKLLEEKQENRLPKPRTLLQLKAFYQDKRNEKRLSYIKTLEVNLKQANAIYKQECLKIILNNFSSHSTNKAFWKGIKKNYQGQSLHQEAKQFGFECRTTPDNGDCFFHAVADQLALQGLSHLGFTPPKLHALVIDFILSHLEDYKNFLDEHDAEINEFIEQNTALGTWLDHLIISALSLSLNVNLVILNSNASPTICKRSQSIATLYLGHEVGQHYRSLIENKLILRTKQLEAYFESALNDSFNDLLLSNQNENQASMQMS